MLKVHYINKQRGKKKVLNDIDFDFKDNLIIGLFGPNGAGKTTLIKAICNLTDIDSGEIFIKGVKNTNTSEIHKYLGVSIEPNFPGYLTVEEILKQACILKKTSKENISYLLKILGLDNHKKHKIKTLSYGLNQRVGIALALVGDPEILILDEPFVGLDPMGIQDVKDVFKQHKENKGSIIISSHQLTEIYDILDYLLFIHEGSLSINMSYAEFEKSYLIKIESENYPEISHLNISNKIKYDSFYYLLVDEEILKQLEQLYIKLIFCRNPGEFSISDLFISK